MSYSSFINNPAYANLFNSTLLNENLINFIDSTDVQSYLNNDPTTIYTLKNLFEATPGVSRNIVANGGTTVQSDPVLLIPVGGGLSGTNTITVPAGTYNLNMKIRIKLQVAQPSNMTYGELVVYNAVDPTLFTTKIAVSSSASFVQSVDSTLTFVDINDTQRIVLATETTLSMIYQYSNSVGLHTVVYGITDGIDYTTVMTLQPTI